MIPSRRVLGACSAVAIGIGGLLAASVARADPPGCHVSDPPSMTVTASGLLVGEGLAYCDSINYRVLTVEVKYQKTFAPDPLTLKGSDVGRKQDYYQSTRGCDDGSSHPYYARAYFTNNVTYHDSPTVDRRSCY